MVKEKLGSGYGLVNAEAAVDLSRTFQASNPETGGSDTGEIIVNDPNQSGGGNAKPIFYCNVFD